MEIKVISAVVSNIQGKVGNTVFTRPHKQGYIARGTYVGESPSRKQHYWREQYSRVDLLYGQLTEEEKDKWKAVRKGRGITRYSNFMHCNLLRASEGKPLIRIP